MRLKHKALIAFTLMLIAITRIDLTDELLICEQTGATKTRKSILGIKFHESQTQTTWIDDILEKNAIPVERTWVTHEKQSNHILSKTIIVARNSTVVIASGLNPEELRKELPEGELIKFAKEFSAANQHERDRILDQLFRPKPPHNQSLQRTPGSGVRSTL